jgi:hypothetical protein
LAITASHWPIANSLSSHLPFVNYEARTIKVETRDPNCRFLQSGLTTFSLHERSLSHRRRFHRS